MPLKCFLYNVTGFILGDPHAFDMDFQAFFAEVRNKELIQTVHSEIFPHIQTVTNLQERLGMFAQNFNN